MLCSIIKRQKRESYLCKVMLARISLDYFISKSILANIFTSFNFVITIIVENRITNSHYPATGQDMRIIIEHTRNCIFYSILLTLTIFKKNCGSELFLLPILYKLRKTVFIISLMYYLILFQYWNNHIFTLKRDIKWSQPIFFNKLAMLLTVFSIFFVVSQTWFKSHNHNRFFALI